jgi:hypothetical protein
MTPPAAVIQARGQMTLDLQPIVTPKHVAGATHQERFEAFHALNPWVLTVLEKLTRDYLAAGRSRVGIGMLFEVLRWQYGRHTTGDEFRLNNNYRSRYARALIDKHPEWDAVFETRALLSA